MLQLHDGKTSRFVLNICFDRHKQIHPYKFWNTDWNLTQGQSYTHRPSSLLKTSVTVWCLKGMIQILSRGNNTDAITAETVHQLKIVETSAHFGAYSSASTHTHTHGCTQWNTHCIVSTPEHQVQMIIVVGKSLPFKALAPAQSQRSNLVTFLFLSSVTFSCKLPAVSISVTVMTLSQCDCCE